LISASQKRGANRLEVGLQVIDVFDADRHANEVVGDAGILVNPTDADAVAEATLDILNDQKLQHDLATTARQRAEMFSWASTARKTIQVFERVLERE